MSTAVPNNLKHLSCTPPHQSCVSCESPTQCVLLQLDFETDIDGKDDIQSEIEAWMVAGFQGLELLFSLNKPGRPHEPQNPQQRFQPPRQSAPMQPGTLKALMQL